MMTILPLELWITIFFDIIFVFLWYKRYDSVLEMTLAPLQGTESWALNQLKDALQDVRVRSVLVYKATTITRVVQFASTNQHLHMLFMNNSALNFKVLAHASSTNNRPDLWSRALSPLAMKTLQKQNCIWFMQEGKEECNNFLKRDV